MNYLEWITFILCWLNLGLLAALAFAVSRVRGWHEHQMEHSRVNLHLVQHRLVKLEKLGTLGRFGDVWSTLTPLALRVERESARVDRIVGA